MVRRAFDILGIEITKDTRAIKKAYALLSKQYHPEEHPAEWEKLYGAYQAALEYAQTQESFRKMNTATEVLAKEEPPREQKEMALRAEAALELRERPTSMNTQPKRKEMLSPAETRPDWLVMVSPAKTEARPGRRKQRRRQANQSLFPPTRHTVHFFRTRRSNGCGKSICGSSSCVKSSGSLSACGGQRR